MNFHSWAGALFFLILAACAVMIVHGVIDYTRKH